MDILGPLLRTKNGNRFLLVIADRYTKMTRTVLLRTVTALSVARALVDQWVYVYGLQVSLLTMARSSRPSSCKPLARN
jgi:hypothetical protein